MCKHEEMYLHFATVLVKNNFNTDVMSIASNRDTSIMDFIMASAIASAANRPAIGKEITLTVTMIVQGTQI